MAKPTKEKRPISVIERRLKSGSIFGTSSKPIPLVEPDRWELRMVNSQVSESHLYDMIHEKGWQYAVPEDLDVEPAQMGLSVLDGRVVRGQHGQEVLMKMERKDYKAIQRAKEAANKAGLGKRQTANTVIQAAAQEPGGDAGASFLSQALSKMDVIDTRVQMPADE